jgi:hypothetical protein
MESPEALQSGNGFRVCIIREDSARAGGRHRLGRQKHHISRTWLYKYLGEGKREESRRPVAMGKVVTKYLAEWHRETPYVAVTDWVFRSCKLKGANFRKPVREGPHPSSVHSAGAD